MWRASRQTVPTLPVATSIALAVSAAVFGASRGFGMFLLSLLILPALLISSVILVGSAIVNGGGGRDIRRSVMLIFLGPSAAYATAHLRDRVLFTGWSLTHEADLRAVVSRDAVIAGWDSWGLAGSENFSYLVSDRLDDAQDVASAERWRVRMGLDCPIVATARMRKGIYIVTTYNCPFDGIAMPG